MVHTPAAVARREERNERRSHQILEAAAYCFSTEGFHNATVSRIAARAGMSVGHIYKYFDSKEAIIAALGERNFQEMVDFGPLSHTENARTPEEVVVSLVKNSDWFMDRDRVALMLAAMSEARRNPAMAELVESFDLRFRERIRSLLARVLKGIGAREIEIRTEQVAALILGLSLRVVARPDVEEALRVSGFETCLRALLA